MKKELELSYRLRSRRGLCRDRVSIQWKCRFVNTFDPRLLNPGSENWQHWLTNEIDSIRLRKYERSFVRNVNKKVRITFVRLIKCKVTLFTSSNHHHYRFFHDHLSASNNEIRLHVHYRISRIRYTCIISYILCFRNERRNLKKQTRDRCNVALIVRRVDWRGQETTAIEKGEKK